MRGKLVTGALAVALLAAGCGGGTPTADDAAAPPPSHAPSATSSSGTPPTTGVGGADTVLAAYARTVEAGSARVSITTEMTGSVGGVTPPEITAEGAVEFDRQRARLTVHLPRGQTVEARSIGTTLYYQAPSLTGGLPDGPDWITIDVGSAVETRLGESLSRMRGIIDSTAVLGYLRGLSDDVQTVGTEQVRGVATTHYRATIDLATMIAAAGRQAATAYDQVEQLLGDSEIEVGVWIDDDDLVRRLSATTPLPDGGVSADATATLIQEFYDYGVDLTIEPPPAAETFDIGALTGQLDELLTHPDARTG